MEHKLKMRTVDSIRWLWKNVFPYRNSLLLIILGGIVRIGTSLTFVWLCKRLIDLATQHALRRFDTILCLIIACILVQLCLSALSNRLQTLISTNLANRLRKQLLDHILHCRWNGRESFHSGDILNRMEEDVSTVTSLLSGTVPATILTLIQLVAATVFLAVMDLRLAGILLFIMPVALLFSKLYMKKMRSLTRQIRTADSRIQSTMQESLQHRILISTLEAGSRVMRLFNGQQSSLKATVLRRNSFSIFSNLMVQAGFAAGYVTAFSWGVYGLSRGTVTFGMLTAFLQLVAQIQRPALDFSHRIPEFINALTSVERIKELQMLPLEEVGSPVRLKTSCGIRFERVTFSYPDSTRQVFKDFSHTFPPGSLTAILGETGCGKSTMIRLMLALLQPSDGHICLYNGEQTVKASPLTRCNFSYVPQGNSLISGTLRDNMLLGNPQADDDEIKAALHTAAADFVDELPAGLDTPCGEKGAGLSEGQAQRIAIARGLLRPGNILLLDEPTSALDSGTEEVLLRRLSQKVKNKTLIIVTHLQQTADLCTSTIRLSKKSTDSTL